MTTMKTHTDAMQSRMSNIASREQTLVQALGDALTRADQKLLDDVRSVSIEHESRRVVILSELQALAARIGAFPTTDEQVEMLEEEALDLPYFESTDAPNVAPAPAPNPAQVQNPVPSPVQQTRSGGDWRKAAKNIRDDFDLRLNGSGQAS